MIQERYPRDHLLDVHISSKWWQEKSGRTVALANIALNLNSSQSLAVLGKSGVGKSTFLKVLAGLELHFEGRVLVDGEPVKAENGCVGLVFQDNLLFQHMTALQNVAFGLPHSQRDGPEVALQWLARVGLEDRAHAFPKDLSGGEKKRVAIARGLVRPPKFLLLDEPLSGLDDKIRATIIQDLKSLQAEHGFGCIVTTHSADDALALGDKAIFLKGRPATVAQEVNLARPPNDPAADAEMAELLKRNMAAE